MPGVTLVSGVPPTTVTTLPETLVPVRSTVPLPVFVTLTLWTDVLPTDTFPNAKLAREGVSVPVGGIPAVSALAVELLDARRTHFAGFVGMARTVYGPRRKAFYWT
jgi:hypothetical protein